MNKSPIDSLSLLAEAADRIEREAYAAGWRDAIAAVSKAASDVAPPEIPKTLDLQGPVPAIIDMVTSKSVQGNIPAEGSTPWYVIQAVRNKPGMTGAEIVAVVRDGGHNAAENSIRTSIFRMRDRKLIVPRHRKWYPA
jgi:hypothetical protein